MIYLDNSATTPLAQEVLKAMLAVIELPYNPSSTHQFGRAAKSLLENSRRTIASYFGVAPSQILFGSGATELLNLLIFGIYASKPGHIISSKIEHSAIYEPLLELQKQGAAVSWVNIETTGAISFSHLESLITEETRLIVLSGANGETGVKNDLNHICKLARKYPGIEVIIDGVALMGKEPISLPPGISGFVFSGHKIHGPKGIGGAVLKNGLKIKPLIRGGGQERSLRPGTENLPAIVGLAKAVELLALHQAEYTRHLKEMQAAFETTLRKLIPDIAINGEDSLRTGHISNVVFPHIDGETLLIQLDRAGIMASHGSACSAGALEPSRVLLEMGLPYEKARRSVRFSFGRTTTLEDITTTLKHLC